MGALLDRNREIARRCGDLSPIARPVQQIVWDGNRDVIMARVSPGSTRRVAPLAVSTLKQRKSNGPERAPMGTASRVIAGCVVSVVAGVGRLSFTKSWPGLGEVARYLNDGTKNMPERPFFGFREIDREAVGKLLRQYVIPQGIVGRAVSFFQR